MAEPVNALKVVFAEIEALLEPILQAGKGPQQRALLFQQLGWDIDAITGLPVAELDQALSAVPPLIDAVKDGLDASDFSKIADLIQSTANAIGSIDRIEAAFKSGLPAIPVGTLAVDLLNFVALRYLNDRFPRIYAALALATLIDLPEPPTTETQLRDTASSRVVYDGQRRLVLRFDRLPQLITDPVGLFHDVYWPRGFADTAAAQEAADRFLPRVAELIRAFGGDAVYGIETGPDLDYGAAANAVLAHMLTFRQPLPAARSSTGDLLTSELDLTVGFVAPDAADPHAGVVLLPSGSVTVQTIAATLLFELDLTATPGGVLITQEGVFAETQDAAIDATLTTTKLAGESGSAVLIGSRDGTHFAIGSIRLQVGGKFTPSAIDPSLGFDLLDAELVIKAGDGDSFLKHVLPPDGMRIPLAFGLSWSPKTGIVFHGGATLEVDLPIDLDLTIIKIPSIHLSLGAGVEAGKDPKMTLGVAATADLDIGPVHASVEQMGVAFGLTFPTKGGRPGPAQLQIGFKPPKGVALSVDAGPVSGGGYILADYDKGEYAGILHLEIAKKISITAIALLQTKMPDGSQGFSLMVLVCAEFSPIQLSYGFTLNGVGGLAGINRSMNVPALQDGLRHGAVGSLLFPSDPVPRARQIIADVGAIFPPTLNQFVIGPMVKIGWGASIVTGTLAIVVQFPAVKIAILGRIQVELPPADDEEAVAVLHLDFAGIIDIPAKTVSFDGSLDGSRVAVFTITGDIAMRAAFGDRPDFALSAGGLYPSYPAPPGFPTLRRLTIALANSDNPRLRLESYFAITPATLQFGGLVEFYYGVDTGVLGFLEVDAAASFDALIVFPCNFVAHFNIHVLLRRNHQPFMGVEVDIRMTGAQPLDITGQATLHFLGDHSIPFHKVIGPPPAPAPLAAVNLQSLVLAALGDPRNWSALPPDNATSVRLRDESGDGGPLRVHPLGTLAVHQTVAPLNVTLEKAGEAPIDGPNLLVLGAITLGSQSFPASQLQVLKEQFASSQFFRLTDQQRLTQPPFELMQSGAQLADSVFQCSGMRGAQLGYEEIEIPADLGASSKSFGKRVVDGAQLTWAIGGGPAAVRGVAGSAERRFANATLGITVKSESQWAVANSNAPTVTGKLAVIRKYATAAEAFPAARKLRAVAVPVEETVA